MSECTCENTEPHYPAADHDEDCPRYQNQCPRCDGQGYLILTECSMCEGSGNFYDSPAGRE